MIFSSPLPRMILKKTIFHDTSYVEYEYDGRSVLRLKHVNAGFNCCPGTISADIQVEGGAIRVSPTPGTGATFTLELPASRPA